MFDPGTLNNLSVGGALLAALWLVLKYRPWKSNDKADPSDARIRVIEVKVDTLWKYVVEAALVDSRQKGVVVANSPVLVSAAVNGQFGPLGDKIKEYYLKNKLDQMNDNEIVWHLYLAFDEELVEKVCLPYGLNMGQALIAALHICKGEIQTQ